MEIEKSLQNCRKEIDRIDAEIIKLIARRFVLVRKVGALKKRSGLPIRKPQREAEIIAKLAGRSDVRKAFLQRLYRTIFAEAYRLEK